MYFPCLVTRAILYLTSSVWRNLVTAVALCPPIVGINVSQKIPQSNSHKPLSAYQSELYLSILTNQNNVKISDIWGHSWLLFATSHWSRWSVHESWLHSNSLGSHETLSIDNTSQGLWNHFELKLILLTPINTKIYINMTTK